MLDFTETIEGVPSDVYQSIMMAERRHYFGAPGRYEEMVERDRVFTLYAEGRPGILATEQRTES